MHSCQEGQTCDAGVTLLLGSATDSEAGTASAAWAEQPLISARQKNIPEQHHDKVVIGINLENEAIFTYRRSSVLEAMPHKPLSNNGQGRTPGDG